MSDQYVQKVGRDPTGEELAKAIAHEAEIATEATGIRGEARELTLDLWNRLRPLLLKPIPGAFIVSTTSGKGKPYASTGVKSVHVLTGRMDAVLTPFWWHERVEYLGDGADRGKLCRVEVLVGGDPERPVFRRESYGGVNQASTIGNLYKGSYTNAAKRAYASVGPGHHVYMGAADLDPDTDADAAKQQAASGGSGGDTDLSEDQRQRVLAAFADAGVTDDEIQLFLRAVGLDSPEDMRLSHAVKLRDLLDQRNKAGGA